jgi:hypothetical protein
MTQLSTGTARPATTNDAGIPVASAKCKRPEVIQRVFAYWRNIDTTIGDRIEAAAKPRST